MKEHECVDCKLDPPKTVRKIKGGGVRSKRCATHLLAEKRRVKKRNQENRDLKVYGMEKGEYDELLEFQGGTCAIPRCPARGVARRLAVDHDHDSGVVRGLLCGPHNYQLLGVFAGDLQAGLDYLANPPAQKLSAKKRSRNRIERMSEG